MCPISRSTKWRKTQVLPKFPHRTRYTYEDENVPQSDSSSKSATMLWVFISFVVLIIATVVRGIH